MVLQKELLLNALKDIIQLVEADDSFEGTISYTCMEDHLKPGEFEVSAFWRTGNSEGQGGCAIIERTKQP